MAPSENVTKPVGVPIPDETAAVKVTLVPSSAGLGVATRSVVVGAALTVWVTGKLELDAKAGSPLYAAVTTWSPTVRPTVETLAWPAVTVPTPSGVTPSEKATVPVGVPAKDVTVAVKVTGAPKVEGFGVASS